MELDPHGSSASSSGDPDDFTIPDPVGWWDVFDGAWHWVTNPTPN
jgi:hypothetical protein